MPWSLYDAMIDSIPAEATIKSCSTGLAWTAVESEGLGLAMSMPRAGTHHGVRDAGSIAGRLLREVAAWVKSWDFNRASIGLAAINAWANAPGVLAQHFDLSKGPQNESAFSRFAAHCEGKIAATIGHFPDNGFLAAAKKVHILERNPLPGDLPDPACEYVLPECAVVFITSVTLTNKTLPRLLALSKEAMVVLVGPGTPMHPVLFDFGVTALGGMCALEPAATLRVVQEGGGVPQIRRTETQFMNLTRAECRAKGCAA